MKTKHLTRRNFHMSDAMITAIDAWAKAQKPPLTRSKAMRLLIERALAADPVQPSLTGYPPCQTPS